MVLSPHVYRALRNDESRQMLCLEGTWQSHASTPTGALEDTQTETRRNLNWSIAAITGKSFILEVVDQCPLV